MIALFTSIILVCTGCAKYKEVSSSLKPTRIKARVTYYHDDVVWKNKVADPKAKIAKEGITVAAHPRFKFGQRLFIPQLRGIIGDGHFIVQDRGSHVTKKVASHGKAYVFDVYIKSKDKLKQTVKKVPMYMDVYAFIK